MDARSYVTPSEARTGSFVMRTRPIGHTSSVGGSLRLLVTDGMEVGSLNALKMLEVVSLEGLVNRLDGKKAFPFISCIELEPLVDVAFCDT